MKILVVDDESFVRDAYWHALEGNRESKSRQDLQSMADELFEITADQGRDNPDPADLDVMYVSQGLDAVAAVEQGRAAGAPFKVAFIDVRMPPGIDGKETAHRIRDIDPDINIVIVTGYSDHSITDITAVAGPADKIMYLKKPFVAEEVRQMADALAARWDNDTRRYHEMWEKDRQVEASKARASKAAHEDFLTGAPNRLAFQNELETRLKTGRRHLSLALLDLDSFKSVNETHGHSAGDQLLRSVYAALRETFPETDFVGRLGEDEFGLLIDADPETTVGLCTAAIEACRRPHCVFDTQISISASAGCVAAADLAEAGAADLLAFAQIALDKAKRDCRGQVCLLDEEMKAEALFRQMIKVDLRTALKSDALSVHYQPIISQETLKIAGFEALLRWENPPHGYVSPAVFIPIAEEGPLIYELGEWILRRALRDSKDWPDQYISVNVSPRQFKGIDLQELFVRCADEAGVPYHRVQIEVTESAVFDDLFHSCEVLKSLHDLGFRIALDDFGTGYSNMSRVKSFALDCIKIDKSFVDDLGQQRNALAIVSSITHLAHSLGLNVVAEGVEGEAQFDTLRTVGCSHIQGYLFGPAEPIDQANERIARDRTGENQYPHLAAKRMG